MQWALVAMAAVGLEARYTGYRVSGDQRYFILSIVILTMLFLHV